MEYNGGSCLVMKGAKCVAMVCDKRLGSQLTTVSMNYEKLSEIGEKAILGMAGLATDVTSFTRTVHFHSNLFKIREERPMKTESLAHFVGRLLYQKRFGSWMLQPFVAGLGLNDEPVIYGYDSIGCPAKIDDFACQGTAHTQMLGSCEALWKPDMDPETLFETASQCFLSAMDRDCFSGWGAVVKIITPTETITRDIQMRMD